MGVSTLNLALRLFAESMLVLVALYVFYTLWEPSFGVTLSLLMTFSMGIAFLLPILAGLKGG
ncbi:hypothetical protein B9Q04_02080 [Candidatus Marsarchaeota G2 archaeon BE_D]|jgi:hypothetical protein|uniref:Uncharacterized protein n=1 Tax=Candidatus Marsarchaeota G2 archaeon BE_D TaxID=1978158 RepID=A0A2R6CDZ0_9ARCH|nr:MAG: hypothetical protein B9Q04_02080 [Candidatus Marsarchaeota G2 archaeon BE_D]